MTRASAGPEAIRVAESIRAACVEAAVAAYEDAGIRGLCAEGRWEAALGAVRQLDVREAARPPAAPPGGTG